MHVLIGYGYHPSTTATYIQRALERRGDAAVTYIGTPWEDRPGFSSAPDVRRIATAVAIRPDLLLYVDSGATWYFPRGLTDLDCATACYLIDVHVAPRVFLKQAMFFDYAFSAQLDFVTTLRRAGHPQAHWLPLACDPTIHGHQNVPKQYDIGFVGSTAARYARRKMLVEQLERHFTMNDFRQTYTPAEMARVYSASHLVFNCSLHQEVNMRVFEGPASGTLLLTDRIDNGLAKLVTDREHVVMYDDDNLLDIANEFLANKAAREHIAARGCAHVQANHTYGNRVDAMVNTIFSKATGPQLRAPLRHRSSAEVDLAYADIFALGRRVDDTIDQLRAMPAQLRYRVPGTKHLVWSLLRRLVRG